MKKLLSLLLIAVCGLSLGATEIVFDSNPEGGTKGTSTNANQADQMELSGIKIATAGGAFACTSTDGTRGFYAYRFGKNKEITITSASNITKVEFVCVTEAVGSTAAGSYDAKGFGANNANLTVSDDGASAVWTGSATEIKLTPTEHQVRAEKVIVTIDGAETLSAPSFSVKAGTYYAAFELELSAATGATIYYTTDGGDPSQEDAIYAEPITVDKSMTVKAMAVKGELVSEVASAEYVIAEAQGVANVAAWAALDDNTTAQLNCELNVFFVDGSNIYTRDAAGDYLCLYGNDLKGKYVANDVVPAGLVGVKKVYNYLLEMSYPFDNVQAATKTATIEPDVLTCAQANSTDVVGHYVRLNNVTVAAGTDTNMWNVTDESGTVVLYGTIAAGTYDYITAVVTYYKPKTGDGLIELKPIYVPVVPTDIENIAALPATADGVTYKITNPVTVVAQSGPQLYITDESGDMLVYGSLSKEYKNGDVLTGIAGTITVYNGLVELVPVADTFGDAVAGPAVNPEVVEEVTTEMVHKFVKIEKATLDGPIADTDNRNFNLTALDGDITLVLRINGFDVTAPETVEGKEFDVTGFVAIYTKNNATTLQLYPTEIKDLSEPVEEYPEGDLNKDKKVNVGDVAFLYSALLAGKSDAELDLNKDGSVNAGDVGYLYKLILGSAE